MVKNTGVTIVPIGIQGAFEAKNKNDWRIKPGILTLHFGKAIHSDESKQMTIEELRDLTREKIIDLIQSKNNN